MDGSKEVALAALQGAAAFIGYATCYGLSLPFRSYIKNYETSVPKRIRQRRKDQFAKCGQKILPWRKGKHCRVRDTEKSQGTYLFLYAELQLLTRE